MTAPTLTNLGQVFHSCVIEEWVADEEMFGVPVLGVPRPWRGGALSFESVQFIFVVRIQHSQPAYLWFVADGEFAKALRQYEFSTRLMKRFEDAVQSRWPSGTPTLEWQQAYTVSQWQAEWTAERISQGLRFPIESSRGNADLGLCVFYG